MEPSPATRIPGRFLVKNEDRRNSNDEECTFPVLASTVSLSFWGGIDPVSGFVVDTTHPLDGQSVKNVILCLPSGRGSCTASQVLLELILNQLAPRAIVMRDVDGLACVGALVASEIFQNDSYCDILHVGEEEYAKLLASTSSGNGNFGAVLSNGVLVFGGEEAIRNEVQAAEVAPSSSSPSLCPSSSTSTELSFAEQQMLRDCHSEAERMALQVLFRYAHILSSEKEPLYVPVSSAHIDGCTYIGPGGLKFVELLVQAGGQVKVPTTLNSVSTDRQRWKQFNVPEDYARNSIALGDAYLQLGCLPSFTCAPYLLSSPPMLGHDIAWGESNAVVFANSVLGARTEKYADYLDICCALTGLVPAVGVHLQENRRPTVILDGTQVFSSDGLFLEDGDQDESASGMDMLFPILGHLCGTLSDGKVPILLGLEPWSNRVTRDDLKSFCAAFGTTGSSPLIHIAGITPEAQDEAVVQDWIAECQDSRRTITLSLLRETFQTLDSGGSGGRGGSPHRDEDEDQIHLVALGNPHLSTSECEKLAHLVQKVGLPKSPNIRVMACLSREIAQDARSQPHLHALQDWGFEVVNDTCWCMLLDPPVIPADPKAKILTNSGKYSHYGPGLTNRTFRFGSLEDCIRTATTGIYARRASNSNTPTWLTTTSRRRFTTSSTAVVLHATRKLLRLWR